MINWKENLHSLCYLPSSLRASSFFAPKHLFTLTYIRGLGNLNKYKIYDSLAKYLITQGIIASVYSCNKYISKGHEKIDHFLYIPSDDDANKCKQLINKTWIQQNSLFYNNNL